MFVMSDVMYGENSVLDTTFTAAGDNGANIQGASVFSFRGPYIYYYDFQAMARPAGPVSSMDYSYTPDFRTRFFFLIGQPLFGLIILLQTPLSVH